MDLSAKGATHSRAIERLSSASPAQAAAVVQTELDELPEAGEPGAVQALTRLQALEVQFERRVQAALKTNNSKLISAARADHGAVAESMRKYEVEIKESERDLGSLIARDEAIEGTRAAATWMRLAFHSWLSSDLPGILALAHNDREAKLKAIETFTVAIENQVVRSEGAMEPVPEWARGEIYRQFHIRGA
jgi:hypothetical protein